MVVGRGKVFTHQQLEFIRMRDESGRFMKGAVGNPQGRPKGAKNHLSDAFLSALADDFDQYGANVIVNCREENPVKYLEIITRVLPRDYKVEVDKFDGLSITELEHRVIRLLAEVGVSEGAGKAEAEESEIQTH